MTKHRRKKSYNPFKMWGSWIGALIGFFVDIIPSKLSGGTRGFVSGLDMIQLIIMSFSNSNLFYSLYLFIFWLFVVIFFGFLLGWGIHSLFRRLK